MKVLLTGASGFVGSHILDRLLERGISTVIVLRQTSPRRFIESRLPDVEVRAASLSDPRSLEQAMRGITHVVHCAGVVKAVRTDEFYTVNQLGTRAVVEAANQAGISRLVHVSSLAAAGPGTPEAPAREADPPRPVSEYGKSKLAAEREVEQGCRAEWVIVRPPAVYGPRDTAFFRLFTAVKSHLLPDIGGGRPALSLVFVKDLADAIVRCLEVTAAQGRTYFATGAEVVSATRFGELAARELGTWTFRLPLPAGLLWPVCVAQEWLSRLTGKPHLFSRQKYAEITAPGWVCDGTRLRAELGIECATPLRDGIRQTAAWYRAAGWL
jgi:nucleoside-diphosphate-sugar epimerase